MNPVPAAPAAPPRASWPLLTVAGLAFIPFVGLVFGAIAVTWGLLSKRPRKKLAIILGAVGAALTIVESAAVVYVATSDPAFAEARIEMARTELVVITGALENHKARHGAYPRQLADLARDNRFLSVIDRSAKLLSTQPYQYEVLPDGGYRLFAVGPDGQPNTMDDIHVPVFAPADSLGDSAPPPPRP